MALARWAGATTWDALSAPPRRAARWVAGVWAARLGPAEMRLRGDRALRGEAWPPMPQHPLPSAVATRDATIDLGGGVAYAMCDGFRVPQFAGLTWGQRSAWVRGFMQVTGVPKFWNFIGVLSFLAEDPDLAPLDSWASVADAGVLQAVQDGWRRYIGLAPIGHDGHGDAGLGWAEFFRRHLQGDPHADQLWGSAEVQGVRFGMAIARREFARAPWHVRDKIEWFVDVGDGYRWVKASGLDLDGPLAPWIRPIFAADRLTSAHAVYAVAKLAVR